MPGKPLQNLIITVAETWFLMAMHVECLDKSLTEYRCIRACAEQKIRQNFWPDMMSGQVQSDQASLDAVLHNDHHLLRPI